MFHRRSAVVAGSAALVLTMSGCALIEPSASTTSLSALAECAYGHSWSLTMDDIAAKILAEMQAEGHPVTAVTAAGTQNLDWDAHGRVVVTSDFDVTITGTPAADQTMTIVESYSGTATGAAYINGDFAIPRKWDASEMTVETTGDNNGTALETIPWQIPAVGIDDSVGLQLTCEGEALTIQPRGSKITQAWTRTS